MNANGQQPRQANHIFVSSQPLARAYSQQTGRHQEVGNNYLPSLQGGLSQHGMAYADGPSNGGQDGDAAAANQDGADQSGGPGSEEDDFECPNNGIFADEASGCQSYHVCQSGAQVQQKFQCPMGTLFNNIILTCDFAHNVQCKGKAQQEAAKAQSATSEEPPANEAPPSVLVPVSARQQQQQQYSTAKQRWSQQPAVYEAQQASNGNGGPRQLRIGQASQYSQHQQNQQSSLAQAVSAYPHPQPAAATPASPPARSSNNNDSDDDSDDDPVEPLIPATLPPARTNLPQPAYAQGPSSAIQPVINQQSAHRSQYPSPQHQQQAYQQHQNAMARGYPQANNGFDGDSASSPVFVGRDEPRATEATINTITNINSELGKQQQQGDAQSFNLVINHLAPTRQQQSPLKNAIIKQQVPVATGNLESNNNGYNKKLSLQSSPKQNQLVSTNQQQQQNTGYTGLLANNKKLMDLKQQQQQQQIASINNKLAAMNAQAQQQFQRANQLRQQQQQYSNQNSYRQASQPKSVHVEARPVAVGVAAETGANPLASSQQALKSISSPSIVDLTNDKRASVSSEAINDGLLLIVRHGTTSPSGNHNSQQSQQQAASYNKGSTQQQVNYKPSSQTVRHSSKLQQQHVAAGGQAFAIDPSAVRANSPIDAQLFPNVQRVLAASQPSVSHQAPTYSTPTEVSSSAQSLLQHAAYKKNQPQTNRQEIRISPPLQPMEPPKPSSYANNDDAVDHYIGSERASSSEAVQVVASSSSSSSSPQTASTIPPQRAAVSPPQLTVAATATATATPSIAIPSQPSLTSQNKKVSQSSNKKENQIKLKPKRLKAQQPPTKLPQKATLAKPSNQRQESPSQTAQVGSNQTATIQQQAQKREQSFGSTFNDDHLLSRRVESAPTRPTLTSSSSSSSANQNSNAEKRQTSHQQ